MGKPRTTGSRKGATLNASKATSAKEQNLFGILNDEADAFPFQKLPRELRDRVYELALEDIIVRHDLICRPSSALDSDTDLAEVNQFSATRDRTNKYPDLFDMLLVDKQSYQEFVECIQRSVPLRISLTIQHHSRHALTLSENAPSLGMEILGMSKMAHVVIDVSFGTDYKLVENPEDVQQRIIQSAAFKNLISQLGECKQATHILLEWNVRLQMGEEPQFINTSLDAFFINFAKCTKLYDQLEILLRSMPNLLCYGMESSWYYDDWMWEHQMLGYGQRAAGRNWNPDQSTRFTFHYNQKVYVPVKQTDILRRWHAFYEVMRRGL